MKLRFEKPSTMPVSGNYVPGTIYFDETSRKIKLATSATAITNYSGVASASIVGGTTLSIVNENGQTLNIPIGGGGGGGGTTYIAGNGIEFVNGIEISLDSSTQNAILKAKSAVQDVKTINGIEMEGTDNVSVGTVTEILTGNGLVGGPITETGTISLATTVIGSTTASSISNIPVAHRAVLATVTSGGNLTFAAVPQNGCEVHVIIHNTGSGLITVNLPSSGNYICTGDNTIYIGAGKYGEVNVLAIGTTGYVHGISSI